MKKKKLCVIHNMDLTKNEIKSAVEDSIREFMYHDKDVLLRVGAHEMSLSHRIAVYMESKFVGYDIDCEYNKHYNGDPKKVGGRKIRPDIIVHRRMNTDALLAIEIKKAGYASKLAEKEIKKLKEICNELGYIIGAYVGVLKNRIDVVWVSAEGVESGESLDDHNAQ